MPRNCVIILTNFLGKPIWIELNSKYHRGVKHYLLSVPKTFSYKVLKKYVLLIMLFRSSCCKTKLQKLISEKEKGTIFWMHFIEVAGRIIYRFLYNSNFGVLWAPVNIVLVGGFPTSFVVLLAWSIFLAKLDTTQLF